jgi:hypothetical protein
MYLLFSFLLQPFLLFSIIDRVPPFNPFLRTDGFPEMTKDKGYDIGTIQYVNPKTFTISSPPKGKPYYARFSFNTGTITFWDGKDEKANLIGKDFSDAAKLVYPWNQWHKDDLAKGRLFRPFVFYDVMGITEDVFQDIYKKNPTKFPIIQALITSTDPKSGSKAPQITDSAFTDLLQPYAFAGRKALLGSEFSTPTIKELRNYFKTTIKSQTPSSTPGKFTILNGYKILQGDDTTHTTQWSNKETGILAAIKYTDIRYLQEAHPGATFQLASNFNCLEGGRGEPGAKLEEMQHQPVQGENASLGTMGATIIRKYVYHDNKNINLLEQLKDKITVDEKGIVTGVATPLEDKDILDIAIGLHENVAVTSGYYPPYVRFNDDDLTDIGGKKGVKLDIKNDNEKNNLKNNNTMISKDYIRYLFTNRIVDWGRNPVFVFNSIINKDIRINQVFTAGLDLKHYKFSASNPKDVKTAKVLLEAAYEGTVLAAAKAGSTKLFLTLVGAGAFGNEISWILDALDTIDIKEMVRRTGMEVILVLYPDIRAGRGLSNEEINAIGSKITKLNNDIQALTISPPPDSDQALKQLASALKALG